ncbi:MAG TPA: hypothetical protein PKC03_13050 [Dokdonella sp.]|jgi:hypothetical protein|nr:hypothetical protein [Dokdonella sp.]
MRKQASHFVPFLMLCLMAAAPARAQLVLPTDIAVRMTASQTKNLVIGEPIDFFVFVTNNGPEPASELILISTDLRDEFNISATQVVDCNSLAALISDPPDPYYNFWWFPTSMQPPLAVGETRECHLRMALFDLAPGEFTFGFRLPNSWEDLDASNNNASVVLRRGLIEPVAVPTLSTTLLLVLAGLIAAFAALSMRRENRR